MRFGPMYKMQKARRLNVIYCYFYVCRYSETKSNAQKISCKILLYNGL